MALLTGLGRGGSKAKAEMGNPPPLRSFGGTKAESRNLDQGPLPPSPNQLRRDKHVGCYEDGEIRARPGHPWLKLPVRPSPFSAFLRCLRLLLFNFCALGVGCRS